jgi:hypothetical protein
MHSCLLCPHAPIAKMHATCHVSFVLKSVFASSVDSPTSSPSTTQRCDILGHRILASDDEAAMPFFFGFHLLHGYAFLHFHVSKQIHQTVDQ